MPVPDVGVAGRQGIKAKRRAEPVEQVGSRRVLVRRDGRPPVLERWDDLVGLDPMYVLYLPSPPEREKVSGRRRPPTPPERVEIDALVDDELFECEGPSAAWLLVVERHAVNQAVCRFGH